MTGRTLRFRIEAVSPNTRWDDTAIRHDRHSARQCPANPQDRHPG